MTLYFNPVTKKFETAKDTPYLKPDFLGWTELKKRAKLKQVEPVSRQ